MASHKDTFLYLATCSHRSLGNFLLSRLDQHARLKKEIMLRLEAEIDQMADNLLEIRMANLLRDHGEEIVSRLGGSREIVSPAVPQKIEQPFMLPKARKKDGA